MAEFRIKWVEELREFEHVTINAELEQKRDDLDIPLQIETITLTPPDVIDLIVDESQSTETIAVLRGDLTDEVLGSKDFYKRIEKPIEVEITAVPKGEAMSLVSTGGVTKRCTIVIDVPKPKLHWRGPPYLADDAQVEVEADGEHEIQLRTWVDQYRPETRDFGYDPEIIEFSHKTEKGFDARIFGPHDDDLPWEKAGPDNNREHSRWISKTALPHPSHPGKVPNVYFGLHTQAWEKGTITARLQNEVRYSKPSLLTQDIPFVLVPVKLIPELVRPEKPFIADGMEVDAVLRISRARDHKPLKKGVISWEIKADTSRGGTIQPAQYELTEADNGEISVLYTPAELTYKPGDKYREDLVIYLGTGADRQEIGVVPLLLRPAIKAKISCKKRGLEPNAPGLVDVTADFSAAEFHGIPQYEAENSDPYETEKFPVCHALVEIDCDGLPPRVGEIKTDAEGKFVWKLLELDEVFLKIPDEREQELTEEAMPTFKLAEDSYEAISTYDDKVRSYTPFNILDADVAHDLKCYKLAFCGQICKEQEESFPKILAAADLLRTAPAATGTWLALHDRLWERGATDIGNWLSEALATLVSFGGFGDSFAAIGNFSARKMAELGTWATPFIDVMLKQVAVVLRRGTMALESIVDALGPTIKSHLASTWRALAATGAGLANALDSVSFGDGMGAFHALWDTFVSIVRFVGECLSWLMLGIVQILGWLAGQALDRVTNAVVPAFRAMRRHGEWLRTYFGNNLGALDDTLANADPNNPVMSIGNWTFGKAMEFLTGVYITWTNDVPKRGAAAADLIHKFTAFAPAVNDSLRHNLTDAKALLIPEDSRARADAYIDEVAQLNQGVGSFMHTQIETDLVMGGIDTFILCAELLAMAAGIVFTGGVMSAATATMIGQFEVVVGLLKTLVVRTPQAGLTFWSTIGITDRYHVSTAGLFVPA